MDYGVSLSLLPSLCCFETVGRDPYRVVRWPLCILCEDRFDLVRRQLLEYLLGNLSLSLDL